MEKPTSAEQLAIALMSDARRLFNQQPHALPSDELAVLADRLSGWSTDIRQLGVDWFTTLGTQRMQISDLKTERNTAREKLAEIRAIAEREEFKNRVGVLKILEVLDRG